MNGGTEGNDVTSRLYVMNNWDFSDCAWADVSFCILVERTGIERHTSQPIAPVHDVGQRDIACNSVARDTRNNHSAPLLVVMANVTGCYDGHVLTWNVLSMHVVYSYTYIYAYILSHEVNYAYIR